MLSSRKIVRRFRATRRSSISRLVVGEVEELSRMSMGAERRNLLKQIQVHESMAFCLDFIQLCDGAPSNFSLTVSQIETIEGLEMESYNNVNLRKSQTG